MGSLIVHSGGQITLDPDVLAHLGVQPGDDIVATKLPGGRIELRSARGQSSISDVFGILKPKNGRVLSIDEINEAIADGWAGAGKIED